MEDESSWKVPNQSKTQKKQILFNQSSPFELGIRTFMVHQITDAVLFGRSVTRSQINPKSDIIVMKSPLVVCFLYFPFLIII